MVRFVPFYNSGPVRSTTKYMALNAINLQCTFDQGKSPNGRDPCHPRAHIRFRRPGGPVSKLVGTKNFLSIL